MGAVALVLSAPTAQEHRIPVLPVDNKQTHVSASVDAVYCSCVRTARMIRGDVPRQNAGDFTPNASPQVGGLALFKYPSGVHHVAVITELKEATFVIDEGNYNECERTQREVPYDYPALRGFWDS